MLQIDELLSEKTEKQDEFVVKGELDFRNYMLIYIRILRAVIQL